MFINNKVLKIFYNALLTGLPSLTYNPINKNILHSPFIVNEYSTYINYKLDDTQIKAIKNYLKENTNDLQLSKTSIINNNKNYYISINIYNCTSPIFEFISSDPVTRCEINTYVVDKKGCLGTLIMDYNSNIISLDPDNLFKKSLSNHDISFNNDHGYIYGYVNSKNYKLKFNYNTNHRYFNNKIDAELVKFSDNIFYNNGLYDKLYYDSSLIHNNIYQCNNNVAFNFLNLDFNYPESVFYFSKPINFVGGLWHNLYE
jgi:hypothetical protein